MIGSLLNAAKNALTGPTRAVRLLEDLAYGELPTRDQITLLVASGVSLYAIADATGFTVEAIKAMRHA